MKKLLAPLDVIDHNVMVVVEVHASHVALARTD